MGKPTGFLEYKRETAKVLPPKVRIANFKEFRTPLNKEKQKLQGARCMACGVPFCQSGMMIGGMASGCPLHNLVPETNDLVYTGNWKQAFLRLSKTHSFPEFTSRVCPALCEAACTCNINGEPVSTKENERAIIETAYENGWVTPQIPEVRTGKSIAVIGSGPSGLAAAQQLNRRGHSVTVFERKDRVGGLLRYGIPNMKLEKDIVERRVRLMKEEGVLFKTGVDVGKDVTAAELQKQFDRVILACGASNPRDIEVPGRDSKNIYFAVAVSLCPLFILSYCANIPASNVPEIECHTQDTAQIIADSGVDANWAVVVARFVANPAFCIPTSIEIVRFFAVFIPVSFPAQYPRKYPKPLCKSTATKITIPDWKNFDPCDEITPPTTHASPRTATPGMTF